MRRAVMAAVVALALAAPLVSAQSPSPVVPTVQTVCLDVIAPPVTGPAQLTRMVRDGTATIVTIVPCVSPPVPETTEAPVAASPAAAPEDGAAYETLGKRAWQRLVRSPDDHVGERIRVWGCISQFDQSTGPDTFRAETYYRRLGEFDWYGDSTNAILSGDEGALADLAEDDVFSAQVTVMGGYEYETTIGGTASAVLLSVDAIRRRGTC